MHQIHIKEDNQGEVLKGNLFLVDVAEQEVKLATILTDHNEEYHKLKMMELTLREVSFQNRSNLRKT
jgi:hypothetical protein